MVSVDVMPAFPHPSFPRRPMVTAALIVLVALTACGGAVRRQEAPALRQSLPAQVRMLFVGGSVTFGLFASTEPDTYPSLITMSLRQSGLRLSIDTVATSGATARSLLRSPLDIPADIIVVQLGANDYSNGVSLAEFSADYEALLHRLRSTSPHALTVCLSGWESPARANGIGVTGAQYDDLIRRLCNEMHGKYLNISPVFSDAANHGPIGRRTFLGTGDWYHPNDRGHARIAAAVLALIAPDVRKDGAQGDRLGRAQHSTSPFRSG